MKKCLAAALALLICMTCFVTPAFAASLGDVNGDNKITAADARLALRAAVGLEKYISGSAAFTACDADGNGKITAADARLILRAAVGMDRLGLTGTAKKVADMLTTYGALENGLYGLNMQDNGYIFTLIYDPTSTDQEIFMMYVGYEYLGIIYETIVSFGVGFNQYTAVAGMTDADGNLFSYGEYSINHTQLSEATSVSALQQLKYEGDTQYVSDLKTLAGGFSVAGLRKLIYFMEYFNVSVDPVNELHLPYINA